ncbi:DHA2 family efflux MFS transporter permease subunit [Nocardia sp. NPDC101769]|uniref:DHA2 family efflux MFS transporter permease subunit n=1 Tax=Nocardia sp. NPDC101769 TaxID=3364333 RepID=UPI0037F1B3E6
MTGQRNPWPALGALIIGFFMILLDSTIVSVANPIIMRDLRADITQVIWVTSAYLLTYAVPLLVTGRLGDRLGPKKIYLMGLAVFTAASLWCARSGSIEILIAARAVQGLGASMMTPQTMAVITRTFPPDRRGAAMGVWGAVAGLAMLVGPILGGVLADELGWSWIFYINVPIGVIAFALAWRLVPTLETHPHQFDRVGVALSAAGMFLLVFGLQEGNGWHWNGAIWAIIAAGLAISVLFVKSQARTTAEPLVPLRLFRDRNFALSSVAVTAMGVAVTSMMTPWYFYLQAVRDLSPMRSALVLAPMAIVTAITGPLIGKVSDRVPPRVVPTVGFALFATSVFGIAAAMRPSSPITVFLVAGVVAGLANSCIWASLASVATRNLPMHQAGAGAGVYNTTRQLGSVLGSAAVAALMSARLTAAGLGDGALSIGAAGHLAPGALDRFSTALGQAMILPAAALVVGALAAALFTGSTPTPHREAPTELPVPVANSNDRN